MAEMNDEVEIVGTKINGKWTDSKTTTSNRKHKMDDDIEIIGQIKVEEDGPWLSKPIKVEELSKPTNGINRKQLWLICRNKYQLSFDLCSECNEKLFQRKDKVREQPNGVLVNFELCWSCAERNMKISEISQAGIGKRKYNNK